MRAHFRSRKSIKTVRWYPDSTQIPGNLQHTDNNKAPHLM